MLVGLTHEATQETIEQAIHSHTLQALLNHYTPHQGEYFELPPGTIHSLGPGLVVLEVQQQSDTTFRLYDWGRTDAQGRPRQLHLHDGLQCVDLHPYIHPWPTPSKVGEWAQLSRNPHFATYRLQADSLPIHCPLPYGHTPWVLYLTQGQGEVHYEELPPQALPATQALFVPPAPVEEIGIVLRSQATVLACTLL